MKIEKRILFGFLKVCILSMLIVSCSSDDDGIPVVDENGKFNNTSFTINSATTSFIESDGKVRLSVSGTYNDGDITSITRGFVYGTSTNPNVASGDNTVTAIGPGDKAEGEIEGLDQNKEYYIRGFIKSDAGDYFYGNEIKTTTTKPEGKKTIKLKISSPSDISITIRSAHFSVVIEEMTVEAPIEIGVQYSTKNDFTDFKTLESSQSEIVLGGHGVSALFLNPSTKYYFRPYAKYRDESILIGEGDSKIDITTKDMKVGDYYPLEAEEFSGTNSSKYIVFKVDQDKRTALLVRTSDIISIDGWKKEDTELGLEVRNPTIEEIKKMKELDEFDIESGNITFDDLNFVLRFKDFEDITIWTSEEESTEKAFTYNPITEEKKAMDKSNLIIKTRLVSEITF